MDRSLLPHEIMSTCEELLSKERKKLVRLSSTGVELGYLDRSDAGVDQLESVRDFLQSIEDYVRGKACALAVARERKGVSSGLSLDELTNSGGGDSNSPSKFFLLPLHEPR